MENETAKVIETIANKLGTTSEYLWRVLLKQAPIESTISIIQMIGCIVGICIIVKIFKRVTKEDGMEYFEDNMHVFFILCIPFLICFLCLLANVCCIGETVTGFFNPEYWALHEILKSIK